VPTGNRGQTSGPMDVYNTRDGKVQVAVTGNQLFKRWAKLMGQAPGDPQWLDDPRFKDDDDRGRHGPIISERMARWCAERGNDEIIDILGAAMIPCAPVLSPQQVLDHPQVRALGLLQDTDYPGLPSPAPIAAVPLWMTETQPVERQRPPTLGEHTDEVLTALGYSADELAALRRDGVI